MEDAVALLLDRFSETLPSASGVVLSTYEGTPLACRLPTGYDADRLARRGRESLPSEGVSALVEEGGRTFLVVFFDTPVPSVPLPVPA